MIRLCHRKELFFFPKSDQISYFADFFLSPRLGKVSDRRRVRVSLARFFPLFLFFSSSSEESQNASILFTCTIGSFQFFLMLRNNSLKSGKKSLYQLADWCSGIFPVKKMARVDPNLKAVFQTVLHSRLVTEMQNWFNRFKSHLHLKGNLLVERNGLMRWNWRKSISSREKKALK